MVKGTRQAGARRGLWRGSMGLLLAAWLTVTLGIGASAQDGLEAPDVTAQGVFAFNPDTGEVIVADNATGRLPIGSVTKIATALVAVDHLELSAEITIASSDMVAPSFSAMGLQPGDTLTVEQLLTGLLVASGGDAAQALARTVGAELSGSDDPVVAMAAFVEAMNAKLSELGLTDTQFANPDGADSDDAWSTARDVAVLYAFLEANPDLAGMAAATEYAFTSVGPEETPYAGLSTNQLAGQHGVLSAKTGATEAAGGCLVLARSIPDGSGTIIVAILGSDLAYDETWTPVIDERWNDATAVMDTIDANWTPGQFIAEAEPETPAADAQDDAAPVADTRPEPRPVALAEESANSAGSRAEPLLVVTVAGGVLALAGVFSWSRIVPPRT